MVLMDWNFEKKPKEMFYLDDKRCHNPKFFNAYSK